MFGFIANLSFTFIKTSKVNSHINFFYRHSTVMTSTGYYNNHCLYSI